MSQDSLSGDDAFAELLERFQDSTQTGNFDECNEALQGVLAYFEDRCDGDDDPVLALLNQGSECEAQKDWAGAELAYRQVLALPELDSLSAQQAHRNLVSLYRLLEKPDEALKECRLAVDAARESDTALLLALTLERLARGLHEAGLVTEAKCHLAEALEVAGDDAMYNQVRASVLTELARCHIAEGQLAAANTKLTAAYEILSPQLAMDFAAAVHSDGSRWWAAMAELAAARYQHEAAIAAWEQAVAAARHVASLPHSQDVHSEKAVANVLAKLADAHAAAGRNAEASATRAQQQEILQAIGLDGN